MKGIVRFLVRMLVLNIVLVPIMVLGPLFYVIPFFCIVANPHENFSGLAQLYFWLGPLSCAFWMLVSCHWPTVRRARRGRSAIDVARGRGGLLAHRPAKPSCLCCLDCSARSSLRSRSSLFSAFAPATRTGTCCGSRFCRSRPSPRSFCSGFAAGCEAGSRGTSSAERKTTVNCETRYGRLLSTRRTSAAGTRHESR